MLVISSHILHGVWNIEERCRATYETINLTLNVMKLTAVSRSWQPHMLVSQNWRYLVAGVTFFQDELDCLLLAPVLYLLLKFKKNYRLSSLIYHLIRAQSKSYMVFKHSKSLACVVVYNSLKTTWFWLQVLYIIVWSISHHNLDFQHN